MTDQTTTPAPPVTYGWPKCPTCGSDDRGDLYGNENGSRCTDPFHRPSSSPKETR